MKRKYMAPETAVIEVGLAGMLCVSTDLSGDASENAKARWTPDIIDDEEEWWFD